MQSLLATLILLGSLAVRADELFLSFEQRLFLSVVLNAAESSPARRMMLMEKIRTMQASALTPEVVAVQSFDQFLKLWRGEWKETDSLSKDLDLIFTKNPAIRRSFLAKTPALQARIDKFIAGQSSRMYERFEPMLAAAISQVGQNPASGQNFDDLAKAAPSLIQSHSKKIEETFGNLMEKTFAGSPDPLLAVAMKTLFSRYYTRLSIPTQVRLLSAMMGADLNSGLEGFLPVLLQNSGPQIQKMLQTVARLGNLDAQMSKLFKTLESDVKPVPIEQVREILQRDTGYEIVSLEPKPLGAGTMAQVHRAVIRVQGRDVPVVIRFLKPGIGARVEEDHRILSEVAIELDRNAEFRARGVPRLAPMIEDVTNTVRAELDLEATIRRQIIAGKQYTRSSRAVSKSGAPLIFHFSAPKIYEPQGFSNLHVQEVVVGEKLETVAHNLQSAIPDFTAIVSEEVAKLWIREALFGSGFYHADLHQGNFLVSVRDADISVSILDFNITRQISRSTQERMIVLMAALALEKGDLAAKTFLALSDKKYSRSKTKKLKKNMTKEMAEIRAGRKPPRGLLEWTAFIVDQGVLPSYDLINLNRGAAIIQQMLAESGSEKDFSHIAKSMAIRRPQLILSAMLRNGFGLQDFMKLGLGQVAPTPLRASGVRCEAVF
jgi:predicted unusual protein kinase regulating ubiquinone biosynthesis (AarF/ABC1/UbiB family)